ncbi:MAG: putative quinol monooxygenase [Rhodospirillaceae bacterium]|nr:putative quinol monooxygenase [Rhodospirillaceae bacterium]
MSGEITLTASFQAKAGHEQDLAAALAALIEPSRKDSGCLLYTLYRDPSVPGRFVFIEKWADRDSLSQHERTPHFRNLLKLLPAHVEGAPQITFLEPVG